MAVDGHARPHGSLHLVGKLRIQRVQDDIQDGIEDQGDGDRKQRDHQREGEDAERELDQHVGEALPGHRVAKDANDPLPQRPLGRVWHRHRPYMGAKQMDRQLALEACEKHPAQQRQEQNREADNDNDQAPAEGQPADDDREVEDSERHGQQQIEDPQVRPAVRHEVPCPIDHSASLGGTCRGFMSNRCQTSGCTVSGPPNRFVSPLSARITCMTALISARCEKACGKLPRWRPLRGSISSAYSCSGLAYERSFSHSSRARVISPISHSADTIQNEQIVNVPSSPRSPSSVSSVRVRSTIPSTVSSSEIASTVPPPRGSSGGKKRTSGIRSTDASSAVEP